MMEMKNNLECKQKLKDVRFETPPALFNPIQYPTNSLSS